MGSRFGVGIPVGENARERWDLGDPTPIVLTIEFYLEHSVPSVAVLAKRIRRFFAGGADRRFCLFGFAIHSRGKEGSALTSRAQGSADERQICRRAGISARCRIPPRRRLRIFGFSTSDA